MGFRLAAADVRGDPGDRFDIGRLADEQHNCAARPHEREAPLGGDGRRRQRLAPRPRRPSPRPAPRRGHRGPARSAAPTARGIGTYAAAHRAGRPRGPAARARAGCRAHRLRSRRPPPDRPVRPGAATRAGNRRRARAAPRQGHGVRSGRASSRTACSQSVSGWADDDIPVRLVALALRLDAGRAFQVQVHDLPLRRAHRLEADGLARLQRLRGGAIGEIDETCFAPIAITGGVHRDPRCVAPARGCDRGADDVLDGVDRLAALADQDGDAGAAEAGCDRLVPLLDVDPAVGAQRAGDPLEELVDEGSVAFCRPTAAGFSTGATAGGGGAATGSNEATTRAGDVPTPSRPR